MFNFHALINVKLVDLFLTFWVLRVFKKAKNPKIWKSPKCSFVGLCFFKFSQFSPNNKFKLLLGLS